MSRTLRWIFQLACLLGTAYLLIATSAPVRPCRGPSSATFAVSGTCGNATLVLATTGGASLAVGAADGGVNTSGLPAFGGVACALGVDSGVLDGLWNLTGDVALLQSDGGFTTVTRNCNVGLAGDGGRLDVTCIDGWGCQTDDAGNVYDTCWDAGSCAAALQPVP